MILKGAAASRYFGKPDPARPGVLIHGEDGMRIALRRQEIVAALIGPEGPAEMRLTRLAAGELRKGSGGLGDAARAMGFFPGPRVVLVEDATDGLAPAFQSALAEWRPGDAQIVATAGPLTGKSALKSLFEKHPSAVCIGLYDDPPSAEDIAQMLRAAGITQLDHDAEAELAGLARQLEPGDFRQMLDKIALYKLGDATALTVAEIGALAPLTIEAEVSDLVESVGDRKLATVGALVRRLEGQGVTPVSICIETLRHFRLLHGMVADPGGGGRRFGMKPRQVAALDRQARSWRMDAVERAIVELVETDLTLRSTSRAPAMAVMERTLLRLAYSREP